MEIKISEIEQSFREIFEEEEGMVQSIETLYEESENEEFLKLIISIQGLSIQDTNIIHTKFIFKTDLEKRNIVENSFIYLYDINCIYHKVDFENSINLKKKIQDIVESNDFGTDILILSDFIGSPATFLNYYMKRFKVTEYSVFDVIYNPKFKNVPCHDVSFDFIININEQYKISLSISKKDRKKDEDHDTYKFQFKFLDEFTEFSNDSLQNIHYFIGSNLAKILDEKLK